MTLDDTRRVLRMGLWVGAGMTPNTTRDSDRAIKQLRGNDGYQNQRTGTPTTGGRSVRR